MPEKATNAKASAKRSSTKGRPEEVPANDEAIGSRGPCARLQKLCRNVTQWFNDNDQDFDDLDEDERRRQREVVPPLLMHAYHLPGNKYWHQDFWQYLTNNHPVFGICLHHKYHPLSWKIRVASLIGSVLFGLALTNIIYLAFVLADRDPDYEYLQVHTNITRTGLNDVLDDQVSSISVTTGNIILWTAGAMIHGWYDNTIWALAACSCCMNSKNYGNSKSRTQRYIRSTGALLVNFSVVLVLAVSTFAALLRAAIDADTEQQVNIMESGSQVMSQVQVQVLKAKEFQDYEFVVSYLVELVLSYIVYYPITGLVLFSGVLSCGRKPFTGGLPYELKQRAAEKRAAAAEESDLEEQGFEAELKSKRVSIQNAGSFDTKESNSEEISEKSKNSGQAKDKRQSCAVHSERSNEKGNNGGKNKRQSCAF